MDRGVWHDAPVYDDSLRCDAANTQWFLRRNDLRHGYLGAHPAARRRRPGRGALLSGWLHRRGALHGRQRVSAAIGSVYRGAVDTADRRPGTIVALAALPASDQRSAGPDQGGL